jgi:hypothetical protein
LQSIQAAETPRSATCDGSGEVEVPQLGVFIVPGSRVKNGEERLVVLNRVARSVVEARRDINPVHVFTYERHPTNRIVGLAQGASESRANAVRVHDLKYNIWPSIEGGRCKL